MGELTTTAFHLRMNDSHMEVVNFEGSGRLDFLVNSPRV